MTFAALHRAAARDLARPIKRPLRARTAGVTLATPHWWEPATRPSHVLTDAASVAAVYSVGGLAAGVGPVVLGLGSTLAFSVETAIGLRRLRRHGHRHRRH